MQTSAQFGLGELLRYVSELVDGGAEQEYRAHKLDYRARYTPVFRALVAGVDTVAGITAQSKLTQGAVSQTVGLMENDKLVERYALDDARQSGIRLTAKGKALLKKLEKHWVITFSAIEQLEKEIGHPLRQVLAKTATALERRGFAERLRRVRAEGRM